METLIKDLEDEIWVELDEFPDYFISNYGRLKRSLLGKVEKLCHPAATYPAYYFRTPELRAEGKRFKRINIHKLVADNFVAKPVSDKKLIVDHLDGDKNNYHHKNLEWITSSENNARAYKNGLRTNNLQGYDQNNKPVVSLHIESGKIQEFGGVRVAARSLNIDSTTIKDVCKGRTSHASGWYFMYYEDYIKTGFPDNIKPIPQFNKKAVEQISLNTGEVLHTFESAMEAEEATGATRSKISMVLSGKRKSSGGYAWRLVTQ